MSQIVLILCIDYFDINILAIDLRVAIVSIISIMLLVAIFKAFIIIPIQSDETCNLAPNVDIGNLTTESRNILSTIEGINLKEREVITGSCSKYTVRLPKIFLLLTESSDLHNFA